MSPVEYISNAVQCKFKELVSHFNSCLSSGPGLADSLKEGPLCKGLKFESIEGTIYVFLFSTAAALEWTEMCWLAGFSMC